ncbi:MAG: chemotaxis-specific protein-glutamate methyltransferase CheB [Bdellovibrionaceae bacterium]|nr:chemotaxis-specific protein-glutamate methyltransferase CheB [Pseudobdellovibrionaceae bacterium]MDW8190137.1 chemotaxis-specific protein-glutamate methyltransferase CheB [Pseudobdellovibrionaceae bacterium]
MSHPFISRISAIISEKTGNVLGNKQYGMVESRLKTRAIQLGLRDLNEYEQYFKQNETAELKLLIGLLTTHHTFFFREFFHFEYLRDHGLRALIEQMKIKREYKLRVWSAAASRGHEPYSLAMFFDRHLKEYGYQIDYEIYATDIDEESLNFASRGQFSREELKAVPQVYLNQHWSPIGKGEWYQVSSKIKSKLKFEVVNLLEPERFLKNKMFHIIFCRNVFIYFSKELIKKIVPKFLDHLHPYGYLVLGVAESITGFGLPVRSLGKSIYQKRDNSQAMSQSLQQGLSTFSRASVRNPLLQPFKVLVVDDSPTIHTMMKKVLTRSEGFEVVQCVTNGKQAIEYINQHPEVEMITLDLHMPEMDGIGFLKHYTDRTRPILIVSSVNRDDPTAPGVMALRLGAFDYVEKPTIENLERIGNEIRSKLKTGKMLLDQKKSSSSPSSMPKAQPQTSVTLKQVTSSPKKVLVIDDSISIHKILEKIISSDSRLKLVGTCSNPLEAEGLIAQLKPDVITLDIHMPHMDGVTLLKKYLPRYPIPTVMISSLSVSDGPYVLESLASGAVDYIQKPNFLDLEKIQSDITERLFQASAAKVKVRLGQNVIKKQMPRTSVDSFDGEWHGDFLVVIGSSTGGTEALKEILEMLPEKIPPILVVQHIPAVFSKALADRLNNLVPFAVTEAVNNEQIKPNHVYIAPGGKQMGISRNGSELIIRVTDDPPVNRHRPSVDYLFKSVAEVFTDASCVVGVILTGMGADGAEGLKLLRSKGATTIGQDESSSVVYGMPRVAFEIGAVQEQLPLSQIAGGILRAIKAKTRRRSA